MLHTSSSIYQNNINFLYSRFPYSLICYFRRVILVTSIIYWYSQTLSMSFKLFYCTSPKVIAGRNQHREALAFEQIGDLCKCSRFTHSIHADEYNHVWLLLLFTTKSLANYVDIAGWSQNFNQSLLHGLTHSFSNRGECLGLASKEFGFKWFTYFCSNFLSHILKH